MDLDLVTILIPFLGLLLGTVIVVAASLWARGVESALGMPSWPAPDTSTGPLFGASGASEPVNPTAVLQPPEDTPPA